VELREAGQATHESVQRGVTGFLNMMRLVEMPRDKPPQSAERQFIAHGFTYARVDKGGMYVPEVPLGSLVREGDRLGTLYGLDFSWEEPVLSPAEGLLYRTAMHRPINSSERVASIATE
jgi:predicted deacylase